MSNEMIERVAGVIKQFWDLHATEPSTGFTPEELAKLAIAAMREPTEAMANAAVDATDAGSDMSWANRSPQQLFRDGYSAMIAAASK